MTSEEKRPTRSEPKTKRLHRGLYEIVGVWCGGKHGKECGGQIRAEWFPGEWDTDLSGAERPYFIQPSWECHCVKCGDCDPNGWPTLAECIREAPAYWMRLASVSFSEGRP